MGGFFLVQTIYGGNSGQENDFFKDVLKNTSSSPTPLRHPHGDHSLDNGFPLIDHNGGQHPNSHSEPQQPVAQRTLHQQNDFASTLSRP
ncbi:hypothetical protein O181_000525 [Austropuccinia psidii MF-1]|uniref:Uncharacterized protein n=1 Tax=Austropuccinia psidii MF-1 TaxID=1389203 RepID=A0A9Q3GAY9_9BASI|nr:hypothetical protein [Austropuccinia psidii MF-1]